jgi:hypothetical protein
MSLAMGCEEIKKGMPQVQLVTGDILFANQDCAEDFDLGIGPVF